jgi:hypothetical protein
LGQAQWVGTRIRVIVNKTVGRAVLCNMTRSRRFHKGEPCQEISNSFVA